MKTFRIVVGPHVYCELTTVKGLGADEMIRLLGLHIDAACAMAHRLYGPSCEVKVTTRVPSIYELDVETGSHKRV